MKILISNVSIKDYPAAAFLRSYYLARGLAKLGHKVSFITNQKDSFKFPYNVEIRDGVKIIAFPSLMSSKYVVYGYTFLSSLLKVIYVLFKKYDIVHSDLHRPTSLIPCRVHRFFYKSKLVSEWWDFLGPTGQYDTKSKYWKKTIGPYDNHMELYSKRISDGTIVLAELLRMETLKLGVVPSKVFKLWGASDIDKIRFFKTATENRQLFNIPLSKIVLIFSGMSDVEFIENLTTFNVLKKLRNEGYDICIARTGKKFSVDYLKKYNISDELFQFGYVEYSQYDKLLSCANAFLLLQSDNNKNKGRWPNSSGDYLAAGRPIISNSIGDLKELETDFPEGFVIVENMEEECIYKNIKHLILNIESLNDKYQKIRYYAENKFSWDVRSKELEDIYKKILVN